MVSNLIWLLCIHTSKCLWDGIQAQHFKALAQTHCPYFPSLITVIIYVTTSSKKCWAGIVFGEIPYNRLQVLTELKLVIGDCESTTKYLCIQLFVYQ